MIERKTAETPDWLQPPVDEEGLGRYVRVLRERIQIILAAVLITVGAALFYLVVLADDVYEARADVLITPITSDDPVFASLGLIRESADPTRDVETASLLIERTVVAERARNELDLAASAEDVLNDVNAEPIAQSNIVAITATAPTAEEAQALANAFAEAAVDERTAQIHDQIRERLPELEAQVAEDPTSAGQGQIARLEALLSGSAAEMHVESEASLPTSPVSPKPALTIAAAILIGLVLGIVTAFALQALDPMLRREEQLRSRYRLPILARIPREAERRLIPLAPRRLSAPTIESYRTLRASVIAAARGRAGAESVLITGSAPAEGKTTTAINVAASLAASGKRVILLEADLRRPAIGEALEIKPERGVVSVLFDNVPLEEALIAAPSHPNLQLLLADYEGGWIADLFSLPAANRLLDDLKQIADFVIIDSPPLTAVIDALPLAIHADDVIIVTRLGVSHLDKLQELGELLATNGIRPLGLAVLGVAPPRVRGYGSYYREERQLSVKGPDGKAGAERRARSADDTERVSEVGPRSR